MEKIILRNYQSPGDIVMLSAAVRDLHRCYPGRFEIDVRTSCPEIWLNNPNVTPLRVDEEGVKILDCNYPLIQQANIKPFHFLHGFMQDIGRQLGITLEPTEFKGDIHLNHQERTATSAIEKLVQTNAVFWIVAAGGKFDYTIKWWDSLRYQEVVDHFRDRIVFIQVGAKNHFHPALRGVVDLRGRTSLRELIRLVYHSRGIVTPVSLLMHLAAAVETPDQSSRPCVVIAGGREPAHWEQYPQHQFLHTNGALNCCSNGGCWRSRTIAIGDGDSKDEADNLCLDVVMYRKGERTVLNGRSRESLVSPIEDLRFLPRCMDMISSADVIRAVDLHFGGGVMSYLTECQIAIARYLTQAPQATSVDLPPNPSTPSPLREEEVGHEPIATLQRGFSECASARFDYPTGRFSGKGLVICGGGHKYFPSTWVLLNVLRHLGCTLPIEIWYLGPLELTEKMQEILKPFSVSFVDAEALRREHPVRRLGGWEMKPYAILHSAFEEVLYIDVDNVPVREPSFLFSTQQYLETGALFWPDIWRLAPHHVIWSICDIPYRNEREFESGQMVINKKVCWKALNLAMHLNEHSDFYYRHILGDKETFHVAWMKLAQRYAMPGRDAELRYNTLYQFDFDGRLLFQHRNGDKWRLTPRNQPIPDFHLEGVCFEALDELEILLDDQSAAIRRWSRQHKSSVAIQNARELVVALFMFRRVGKDSRPMTFSSNGKIIRGASWSELYWDLFETDDGTHLEISSRSSATVRLLRRPDNSWFGHTLCDEQSAIELIPQPTMLGARPIQQRRALLEKTKGRPAYPTSMPRPMAISEGVARTIFHCELPRVFHIVGISALSVAETMKHWSAKHRGWEVRAWTESSELDDLLRQAVGRSVLGSVRSRFDLALCAIPFLLGGVSVSAGRASVRNIEPLLQMVGTDVFAGLGKRSSRYVSVVSDEIVGSLPGATFLRRVIDEAKRTVVNTDGTANSVAGAASEQTLCADILTRLSASSESITIFPKHIFDPDPSETSLAYSIRFTTDSE